MTEQEKRHVEYLAARLAEAERLLLKFHTAGPSGIAALIDEVPAFLGIFPMPTPDETGICPSCGEGISAHHEGECRAADSADDVPELTEADFDRGQYKIGGKPVDAETGKIAMRAALEADYDDMKDAFEQRGELWAIDRASLDQASDLLNEALHQLWHAIEDPDNFDKQVARRAIDSIQERAEKIWPIDDGGQDGTNTPGADKYWNW